MNELISLKKTPMRSTDSKRIIDLLRYRNTVFDALVFQLGYIKLGKKNPKFESLLKIIINQQLSKNVADTIFSRLKKKFDDPREIIPICILNADPEDIRNIGISASKVKFMKDLATKFINSPEIFETWSKFDDIRATSEIQKLNGFGPWSAKIILMSYMGRDDIFPENDSTLKKGYFKIYGKYLSEDLKEIDWARPYRSILARYIWKWVDNGMVELK